MNKETEIKRAKIENDFEMLLTEFKTKVETFLKDDYYKKIKNPLSKILEQREAQLQKGYRIIDDVVSFADKNEEDRNEKDRNEKDKIDYHSLVLTALRCEFSNHKEYQKIYSNAIDVIKG